MKFADIAKRAKAMKIACVLTDENGVQWVNVGAAVYRLEGLPKMSSEDFLRLAGVSEEKIGSFYVEGACGRHGWIQADAVLHGVAWRNLA